MRLPVLFIYIDLKEFQLLFLFLFYFMTTTNLINNLTII